MSTSENFILGKAERTFRREMREMPERPDTYVLADRIVIQGATREYVKRVMTAVFTPNTEFDTQPVEPITEGALPEVSADRLAEEKSIEAFRAAEEDGEFPFMPRNRKI